MKRTRINKFKALLYCIVLAVSGAYLISCQDNEVTASGPPTISGVRLTDPTKADSTFNKAFPGTTIVIEGDNFVNVKSILLNGIPVYFNSNYILKNSIIVSIPGSLPLRADNPELPNTITVVNDKGSGSFDFSFLAPKPFITLLKFPPPAEVGKEMKILGGNFFVVQKVQFKVDGDVTAEVTDFQVSEDYDTLTFNIPVGGTTDGMIVVVTESGKDSTTYLSNPFPEFITLSDDYQIPGDTLTIVGKYFDFVNKVVFPGGIEVAHSKLHFNALNTQIDLIVPDGITGSAKVQLVTDFGDIIESPFIYNDLSGVIMNWEAADGDWGKGSRETADGTKMPYVGSGKYLHMIDNIGANVNWWEDPLVLAITNAIPSSPQQIPDNTLISKIGIAFNYYTANDWTQGYVAVRVGGHPGGAPHGKVYPASNYLGKSVTKRWQTYTVPLSEVIAGESWAVTATTWADFKAATNGFNPAVFMQFFNEGNPDAQAINQFYDNVRFIKTN